MTYPVTENALIKRINRKLAPEMQRLRITRGLQLKQAFGRLWVHDYTKLAGHGFDINVRFEHQNSIARCRQ